MRKKVHPAEKILATPMSIKLTPKNNHWPWKDGIEAADTMRFDIVDIDIFDTSTRISTRYVSYSRVLRQSSRAVTTQWVSDHLDGDECPTAVWSAHARPSPSSHNISFEHSFISLQPQNKLVIFISPAYSVILTFIPFTSLAYTVHISFSRLQTCQFITIDVNIVTIHHFFVVPPEA